MVKHFLIALLLLSLPAQAEDFYNSVHPVSALEWKNKNEILEYQSCGCADSCWTAKLLNKKRELIAELRCDCKSAFAKTTAKLEWKYAESCEEFEQENKMEAITNAIKKLVRLPN